MKRRINWLKISIWATVILAVAAGIITCTSYVLIRRTPEWYQPDTSTEAQRNIAAKAVEDLLASIHTWGSSRASKPLRTQKPVSPAAADPSTQQGRAMLGQKPDEAFDISFTDDQLNAFFNKWANTRDRREWFEKYVENPRLVLRANQLIVVGKIKESQLVVSLVFEPRLDADQKLDLNLANVFGGVLPVPDAMWNGQRTSIENTLRSKLPSLQDLAMINPDGIANGSAGAAAMNEMLQATLRYKPANAVIFVPLDRDLSQNLPVKITALSIQNHTLKMTAEQMSEEERTTFLKQLKTSDEPVPETPSLR